MVERNSRGKGQVVIRMKAIQYTANGDATVLQLVERPVPDVGPGEVRVRVVVSGVNPTDWKARQGSGSGSLAAPQVPNQDGAGVVDAVGAGVTRLAAGDRVWVWDAAFGRPDGTAQEFVVLPEFQVVALPAGASFDLGASLGIPAMTAHRALTTLDGGPDRLEPGALAGQTVLVAGGAGAVGNAAIQLAAWAGATVVTTVSSPEKAELARKAGAHHVVNYRIEYAAARIREIAPNGVNLIVEVAPAVNADLIAAVVAQAATVAIYATDGGDTVTLPIRHYFLPNTRFQFLSTYTTSMDGKANAIQALTDAIADGALTVGEDRGLRLTRFPFEQTAAAHDAVAAGTVGKVLIDVAEG
ncbi:MAG: NADPH:quinone reductase [Microbacteriaceae bacterium]|nr:NADPH:quinone reductase [Microbacteriaceae bacterium]